MASFIPKNPNQTMSVSNETTQGNTTHYDIDDNVSVDLKNLQQDAKARMDAKMQAKFKLREEKRAAKKAEKARREDPNESVPVFWSRFNTKFALPGPQTAFVQLKFDKISKSMSEICQGKS